MRGILFQSIPIYLALLCAMGISSLQAKVLAPTREDGTEVPMRVMEKMISSHEALQGLDFASAERQSLEAVSMYPNHPLPHLFLAGVYLFWIQENEAAKIKNIAVVKKFNHAAEEALNLSNEQSDLYPDSAYPLVYQGATLGTQGMVNLYQKHYWSSYRQGLAAAKKLRQAVQIDPQNRDVYFGLGQFEYYCGRLSGILQFFFRLHGDENEGLKMIERSATGGTYSVLPAKAFLAQVYMTDRHNWKKARPYVDDLYGRFPESYYHVRNAIQLSLGLGLQHERNKRRLEAVCEQWDKGWRPPEYATVSLDPARLALAEQYLKEKKPILAAPHLSVLTQSEDSSLARRAKALWKELPLVKP